MYQLILFDIDGTLADRDTHDLLPGVAEWFTLHHAEQDIALITNQGGVGLRHWMEDGGFGDPSRFPTEQDALNHIQLVNDQLPGGARDFYVCFAYQSKKSGKWGPIPVYGVSHSERWLSSNRKPAPGMILAAIRDFEVQNPDDVLMVGDGEEDQQAAEAAGVHFAWAADFFQRLKFSLAYRIDSINSRHVHLTQFSAMILPQVDHQDATRAMDGKLVIAVDALKLFLEHTRPHITRIMDGVNLDDLFAKTGYRLAETE